MSEEKQSPEYELAKRKVDAIIGFKVHFIVYLGVNALLLLLNLLLLNRTGADGKPLSFVAYFWCVWPIACWGLGVFLHYMAVRQFTCQRLGSWKEEQIRKFMEKPQEER